MVLSSLAGEEGIRMERVSMIQLFMTEKVTVIPLSFLCQIIKPNINGVRRGG